MLNRGIVLLAILVSGCMRGATGSTNSSAPCGALLANSIAFAAPPPGTAVSGVTTFAVDVSAAPSAAAVRFAVGALVLGVATSPPYAVTWNTALAADGSYDVEATALSASGETLARTSMMIDVDNRGGGLTIDAPELVGTLRGTVTFTMTASDPDFYPARWNVFLDGILVDTRWTDNWRQNQVTLPQTLDTTIVSNGRHELHVDVGSDFFPASGGQVWHDHRAATVRSVTIDNGHTLMDVVGSHQHVYLRPGESLRLGCTQRFTDATTGPCGAPTYDADPASIVTVDGGGMATAGATGFATVTIRDGGKTASVYVWVSGDSHVPHFSGSGALLSSYQPGSSIFMVAPFELSPQWPMSDPAIDAETKRAGFNTLTDGFYLWTQDLDRSWDSWRTTYDALIAPRFAWAASNGYHLYGTGDSVARNIGQEAWWTLNWPRGMQAVQYAMQSFAGSGVAVGVDVIDEGSMMWGWTPTPPRKIGEPTMFTKVACSGTSCVVTWPANPVKPGRFFAGVDFALTGSSRPELNTPPGQMFTATNVTDAGFSFVPAAPVTVTVTSLEDPGLEFLWWAGSAGGCPTGPCDPPVPNTALATIAGWLRTATPHVPISWPALGVAPPIVQSQWMGKDSAVSDYASHYWDSLQAGHTYAWGVGVAERIRWMRDAYYGRQNYVIPGRPQLMLSALASFFYRKGGLGDPYYHPPIDELLQPGATGSSVTAELMTAAALGNAGVRLYKFESTSGEQGRADAPVGSVLQTGANPFSGDANAREIWRAAGYAANLLTKRLAPFVLGRALSSPGLGPDVVTAARRGEDGNLLMVTNGRDRTRALDIRLDAYRTGGSISRYIVGPRGIRTTLLGDRASDSVVLDGGESVVYLIADWGTPPYLTPVAIPPPTLPSGASSASAHYGYLYQEDLGHQVDGTSCTAGCTLSLDPSLGAVYRQLVFTDCAGRVVGRGAAEVLVPP